MNSLSWYSINNIDALDTPSVVVYPDLVMENIKTFIKSVDDISRLRPHVKTHKSADVVKMMLDAGIKKFKCATIAEAEMLATAGAKDILVAYQPVGPKVSRLLKLVTSFPGITWACLVDNADTAHDIAYIFERSKQTILAYIDLNVGMNRTGIVPYEALRLFEDCAHLKGLTIVGLHAYDGHLRESDFAVRKQRCDEAYEGVKKLRDEIFNTWGKRMITVVGGSPTFSIHSKRNEVECSPGTFIYWDKSYEQTLQEQHYFQAALVVTRVISIPAENTLCVDLGHKAIAAENPLPNRVFFINAPELEPIGHSEEHMVFKTKPEKKYSVGDVLFGVPYHVCPTIALHDTIYPVVNHQVQGSWITTARKRKITI
jgi:D-serine deaminase-like pyridoxal phosphate-dependent protein